MFEFGSPDSDAIKFLGSCYQISGFSSSWEKFRKSYHIFTQKNFFHEPTENQIRKKYPTLSIHTVETLHITSYLEVARVTTEPAIVPSDFTIFHPILTVIEIRLHSL